MSSYILKADPGRDLYTVWADGPEHVGTRTDIAAYLAARMDHTAADIEARLTRADTTGTSAVHLGNPSRPYGGWDHDRLTVDMTTNEAGELPRAQLANYLDIYLARGRQAADQLLG